MIDFYIMRFRGVVTRAKKRKGIASKAEHFRPTLYAGFGIVLICHAVALYLVWTLSLWESAGLMLLVLASALAATGFFIYSLRWLRITVDSSVNQLALWLRNIDFTSEQPYIPALHIAPNNSGLVEAIEDLVLHVHRYRDELLIRHQRVQRLLRNVNDVLYHVDSAARITWITDTVKDMLGYAPSELIGQPLRHMLADPETDYEALINSSQLVRQPTRVYRRDGSVAWLLISSRRIDDAEGCPIGSEGVCRDGTRLIETERALSQEKERAQVTLASIDEGVITTNAHGQIDYLNPRAQRMLNINATDALSMHLDMLFRLTDGEREIAVEKLVYDCIENGTIHELYDNLTLYDHSSMPNAPGRAVTVKVSPISDTPDKIVGTVIVLHDITRLHQITSEMAYQANHDPLTGLPNRRAFEQELRRYIGEASASASEHALCYLDLDQFKLVNDTCGHNAGDEMLRQITSQLASQLRTDDRIARLGGDEFGVVMLNLSLTDAQAKAEALRNKIDSFRFCWEDNLFRLGVSIGVTAIDRNAVSATEILRRADAACYMAKEKGRNQVYVYNGDSNETQTWLSDMQRMQQISEALENDSFELFGQIIRPLKFCPGMQIGLELLLRVPGTGHSPNEPQNFLLTAEHYNAASRIDRWVLRRSLELIAAAPNSHDVIEYYSINISGQSIADENFINYARKLIQNSPVDPKRLVFEITETAIVTTIRRANEHIRSLRALGCRFSLDDFGSGLSSFSYLKNLPSDYIKIDGKLVCNILDDPVERSFVESINHIGQVMGLKTVAEHVESIALLEELQNIGVDYVQGYQIARPIPFEKITESLKAQEWATDKKAKQNKVAP